MNLKTKMISPGGPDSFQCLLWMTNSHSSSEPWVCKSRRTSGTAGPWVCRQDRKTYTAVNFFPRKQTTQKISSCFSFLLLLSLLFLFTFETYVLLPDSCCHHLPHQWISSLHELRGRHLIASFFSIQMWSSRVSWAQEVDFTIKVILWIQLCNIREA